MKTNCATSSRSVMPRIHRRTVADAFTVTTTGFVAEAFVGRRGDAVHATGSASSNARIGIREKRATMFSVPDSARRAHSFFLRQLRPRWLAAGGRFHQAFHPSQQVHG